MENILDTGLQIIRGFQSIRNPFWDNFFVIFTTLGEAVPYVLAVLVIIWCVDFRKGFYLGFVTLFSETVNIAMKNNLKVPRPLTRDESLAGIIENNGICRLLGFTKAKYFKSFSTPSGHAQIAIVFWYFFCLLFKVKKQAKIFLAVLLPVLVGISRFYLGVHYPSDVLLGWMLGILTVLIFLALTPAVKKHFNEVRFTFRVLVSALPVYLFLVIYPQAVAIYGILFGYIFGYLICMEKETFMDSKKGSAGQKILRVLLGLVGALMIFMSASVAKSLFTSQTRLIDFVFCTVIGLWFIWLSPALMVKIHIASYLE